MLIVSLVAVGLLWYLVSARYIWNSVKKDKELLKEEPSILDWVSVWIPVLNSFTMLVLWASEEENKKGDNT
jgi:hypothetical protein